MGGVRPGLAPDGAEGEPHEQTRPLRACGLQEACPAVRVAISACCHRARLCCREQAGTGQPLRSVRPWAPCVPGVSTERRQPRPQTPGPFPPGVAPLPGAGMASTPPVADAGRWPSDGVTGHISWRRPHCGPPRALRVKRANAPRSEPGRTYSASLGALARVGAALGLMGQLLQWPVPAALAAHASPARTGDALGLLRTRR